MKSLLCILIFSTSTSAWANNELLGTAWSDSSYLWSKENSSDLQSPGYRLFREGSISFSREQEFKKNGDFKNEIGIKLQPFSWKEISLHGRTRQDSSIDYKKVQLGRSLLNRYELIVQYVQAVKKFKLLNEVSEIASKNYKTQLLASQIGRADAKKIIRARLDWAKMRTDLSETEAIKNQLADKLKQIGVEPESLNSSNWLSPQSMKTKVSTLPVNTVSISQKLNAQEYQDLLHDYELSQGKRYSLIDSIELAYSHLENDRSDSSLEFKISFNLPFLQTNEGTSIKARSMLNKHDKWNKESLFLERSYEVLKKTFSDQLQIYTDLKGFFANSKAVGKSLSLDPQLGIETLLETLSARCDFLDLEQEVYLQYLQLMYESAQMLESPNTNFLLASGGNIK